MVANCNSRIFPLEHNCLLHLAIPDETKKVVTVYRPAVSQYSAISFLVGEEKVSGTNGTAAG